MEERRLLLAVALSLVVLTGYSLLFSPAPPAGGPGTPTASPAPSAPAAVAPASPSLQPPAGRVEAPRPTEALARQADERERRVEVKARDYAVAFTNRGARLVSWTLENYRDARGRPEEMVSAQSASLRPLDIETGDAGVDERLRTALFVPSPPELSVTDGEPQTLSFRFSDGEIEAEKAIDFRATGLVALRVSVRRAGQPLPVRLLWGPGLGNPTPEEREVRGYLEPHGVVLQGTSVQQLVAAKLPPGGQTFASPRWVGLEGHYFTALFVPGAGGGEAAIRAASVPGPRPDDPPVQASVVSVAAGAAPVLLYVGAKDHTTLSRLGYQLERVVQLGDWLGPIVLLLMRLLRWVQGHVGNWGWSIVLLTILINLVMAPFRHYSIVNGFKMAKISPEMRVIQERYRKVPLMDPRRQQMQEEMGQLYAKHGMSMGSQMAVGCLPILLTMPFLFAFYKVLSVAIELRGAPFLWIADLAQKDPLFVTPVLMGASMFVMQKMTPSAMDPAQQRIMMLMPLMLAGMFLWAPAGLNLYWLTSNVWSVVQQAVEMRLLRSRDTGSSRERRSK